MPSKSYAGWFGDHPRYLHALSDMRYAKSLIARPDAGNVMADERAAVNELNAAIGEISEAAKEDWKPVNDHPPVDTSLDQPGRLHEAVKILSRALQDLNQEEDNGFARGLRNKAIHHLQVSRNFVRKAVGDKEWDAHL
jgi:hypothetical protein